MLVFTACSVYAHKLHGSLCAACTCCLQPAGICFFFVTTWHRKLCRQQQTKPHQTHYPKHHSKHHGKSPVSQDAMSPSPTSARPAGPCQRIPWQDYFMRIAYMVSTRSTCLRRKVGCVLVKDKRILATGYNGAPRGRANCIDCGVCIREKLGIPRGERYEVCRSVHAEANAIISASRKEMLGATLYLVGRDARTGEYVEHASSCSMCKRMVINAGIETVYIRDSKNEYRVVSVADWVDNDESLEGVFGY